MTKLMGACLIALLPPFELGHRTDNVSLDDLHVAANVSAIEAPLHAPLLF
jgi:hypothetical protein